MGEIEDRAGALVQHVGIEALGAKQSDVALDPLFYRLQTRELAFEHILPPVEFGARLKTVIAGLQVIGEITRRAAGEERQDESRDDG